MGWGWAALADAASSAALSLPGLRGAVGWPELFLLLIVAAVACLIGCCCGLGWGIILGAGLNSLGWEWCRAFLRGALQAAGPVVHPSAVARLKGYAP